MVMLTWSILSLTFAVLSLGHKERLGHKDCYTFNSWASVIYEVAAVGLLALMILTLLGVVQLEAVI